MSDFKRKCARVCGTLTLLTLVLAAAAAPTAAQKSKDKKKNQPDAAAQTDSKPMIDLPDTDAIDKTVGEALGYWQIGDIDSLRKYYSNDVVMVSGVWEPPVIGWDNFLKSYQTQRASVTGGRIDRSNTFIKADGNSGWATYQFVYTAMADSRVVQFHGHTTLVLNKVDGRWVIVLNHSSIVDAAPSSASPAVNSAPPGRS